MPIAVEISLQFEDADIMKVSEIINELLKNRILLLEGVSLHGLDIYETVEEAKNT